MKIGALFAPMLMKIARSGRHWVRAVVNYFVFDCIACVRVFFKLIHTSNYLGECDANPNYMLKNCLKSCNLCRTGVNGEGLEGDKEFLLNAILEYGVPQSVEGNEKDGESSILSTVRDTVSYMRNFVHANNPTHRISLELLLSCKNKMELCSTWANSGQCSTNDRFMNVNCAPACLSCHKNQLNDFN